MPAIAVALSSCGSEDLADSSVTVRDSADVRIVENGEAPDGGWNVGAEPLFTMGWDPDGPTLTWSQSGRILPDGGAVIGDIGGTIYRVGPDGSVVGTWGGRGEGPGEYQRIEAILLWGDSIVVSDAGLGRATVLSREGEVRATIPLAGTFRSQASAIMNGGRILLVPGGNAFGGAPPIRMEWVFENQPILSLDPNNRSVDTLAELPHLRRWYGLPGAPPGVVEVKGRAGGFADGFAWARADKPEVRWYDTSGRLVQVARWDEEPVPLTTEWRERIARVFEEGNRSLGVDEAFIAAQQAELEEWFDRYEGPVPYWDFFHMDRLGNAWLSRYAPPLEPPGAWRVIARDGSYLGWVDLPEVVALLDITDDRILAVWRDELDVSAVVMLELTKP